MVWAASADDVPANWDEINGGCSGYFGCLGGARPGLELRGRRRLADRVRVWERSARWAGLT